MHFRLPTLVPVFRMFCGLVGLSSLLGLLGVLGCAHEAGRAVAPAPAPAPAAGERVVMGDVTLVVMTSRTASLFHAVDQLSRWSPFSHPQYQKWRPDGAAADELLARHAKLRAKLGWGRGLEDALYVADPDHGHALDAAVARGGLDAADAKEEKAILDGLSPLLEARIRGQEQRAEQLTALLRENAATFSRLFGNWLALVRTPSPGEVGMMFVPSPGHGMGGGGANGHAIVIELPEDGTVHATMTTVAHEMVHVLLRPRQQDIEDAARQCGDGLDTTTIGEGFAYATAPGLFAYGVGRTRLEEGAAHAAPNSAYGGFYAVALALRPSLRARLGRYGPVPRGFPTLLDAICVAWKARAR
jgi:hypothetical protein